MTITLPDDMRGELERKAKASRFKSVDDYLVHLVISDDDEEEAENQNAPIPPELIVKDRAYLEAKLREGLQDRTSIPVTPEYWKDLERRVEEHIAAGRKPS